MFQIGTGHIGPHLYMCALMHVESRYIVAFRFGKSNSDNLKLALCADCNLAEIPPTSRMMSSFFSALSAEKMLLYKFRNNYERMAAAVEWLEYYNTRRPHSSLGYRVPFQVFTEMPDVNAEQQGNKGE